MHSFPVESLSCVGAARRDVSGKCLRLGTLREENPGKLKDSATFKPPQTSSRKVAPKSERIEPSKEEVKRIKLR